MVKKASAPAGKPDYSENSNFVYTDPPHPAAMSSGKKASSKRRASGKAAPKKATAKKATKKACKEAGDIYVKGYTYVNRFGTEVHVKAHCRAPKGEAKEVAKKTSSRRRSGKAAKFEEDAGTEARYEGRGGEPYHNRPVDDTEEHMPKKAASKRRASGKAKMTAEEKKERRKSRSKSGGLLTSHGWGFAQPKSVRHEALDAIKDKEAAVKALGRLEVLYKNSNPAWSEIAGKDAKYAEKAALGKNA